MKKDLERWHKTLASAAGQLSTALVRGSVRRGALRKIAADVRRAVEEMDAAQHPWGGSNLEKKR